MAPASCKRKANEVTGEPRERVAGGPCLGEELPVARTKVERIEALEALLKTTDRSDQGREIREAITKWCDLERVMAPANALEFPDHGKDEREDWDHHCGQVDKIWDRYAGRFAEICGCDKAILVKPSGMFNAIVSILWHYPSFNTANERFGMVFDPSNKCLNLQLAKLGPSGANALSVDTFPMRASPPKKQRTFHCKWTFWAEYRNLAMEFQYEITKASKVRIVLGRENWELVCRHLEEGGEDLVFTRVALSNSLNYYEERAHLLVVRDTQRAIKQIILPSYHLEWLFRAERTDRNLEMARMMDTVWNFAAAVSGMDTVHLNYFEWKVAQSTKEQEGEWLTMKGNDLWKVRVMLGWEKANGPISEEVVVEVFSPWLQFNSERLIPENGTLCRQIFMAISARTWEVNKEKGHPGLVVGRATHAIRLENAVNAKWAVIMRDFVGVWSMSREARDRAWADKCRDANYALWRDRGKIMSRLVRAGYLKWYSKRNPNGLRYAGDGGGEEYCRATGTGMEAKSTEHSLNLREWWQHYSLLE